jgi:hypothetical protein
MTLLSGHEFVGKSTSHTATTTGWWGSACFTVTGTTRGAFLPTLCMSLRRMLIATRQAEQKVKAID